MCSVSERGECVCVCVCVMGIQGEKLKSIELHTYEQPPRSLVLLYVQYVHVDNVCVSAVLRVCV